MPQFEIRRLVAADFEDYRTIRLDSLRTAPEAFGSVYETEATRPVESFIERLVSSVVLGAYATGRIVGVVGLKQETAPKERHKAVVWGVYVQPQARGLGIATALIARLIDSAPTGVERLNLTVVQGNGAAIALYRRFGFEIYGVEPRARKTPQGYVDIVLMALDLRLTNSS